VRCSRCTCSPNRTGLKRSINPPKGRAHDPQNRFRRGTILPVRLNTALRSDKIGSGTTIIATVMQDVAWAREKHCVRIQDNRPCGRSHHSWKRSDESKISFQFDQLQLRSQTIPLSTTLRAVASTSAVLAATPELTSPDYADNQIQIGGDQISYGERCAGNGGIRRSWGIYQPRRAGQCKPGFGHPKRGHDRRQCPSASIWLFLSERPRRIRIFAT